MSIFVTCCNAVHKHQMFAALAQARSCMQQKLMLAVRIACAMKCTCTHAIEPDINIRHKWIRKSSGAKQCLQMTSNGDAAL